MILSKQSPVIYHVRQALALYVSYKDIVVTFVGVRAAYIKITSRTDFSFSSCRWARGAGKGLQMVTGDRFQTDISSEKDRAMSVHIT